MNPALPGLGQRIRLHRVSRGETQEEFAVRLGVCRSTVTNWERGILPEPFATLIQEIEDAQRAGGQTYQLSLPFDDPMDLEVRIYPKKPDSIRLEVDRKQKAS